MLFIQETLALSTLITMSIVLFVLILVKRIQQLPGFNAHIESIFGCKSHKRGKKDVKVQMCLLESP